MKLDEGVRDQRLSLGVTPPHRRRLPPRPLLRGEHLVHQRRGPPGLRATLVGLAVDKPALEGKVRAEREALAGEVTGLEVQERISLPMVAILKRVPAS